MTDDFYENALTVMAVIAVLVVAAVVLLLPQAFGLTAYRLFRERSKAFAALLGFLLPLVFYCLFFKFFWYDGLGQAANNPPGEGDMVIPALVGYGLLLNVGGGLSLYVYLYFKNGAADTK